MELDGLTWLRSHPKGPWELGGDLLFPIHPPVRARKAPPRCQTQFGFLPSAFLAMGDCSKQWRSSCHRLPRWAWSRPCTPTASCKPEDPSAHASRQGPLQVLPLPPARFPLGLFFVCFLAFNQGSGSRREGEDCDPTLTPSCKHPQSGCTARACPRTGELPTSPCSRRCHSSTETPG